MRQMPIFTWGRKCLIESQSGKRLPQIHTRIADIHRRQMGRYDGPSGLIADISDVQATLALAVRQHLPRTQHRTASEH